LDSLQIDIARSKGFRLFGCNRVFQIVPDLEIMYACNRGFWDRYYTEAAAYSCTKWTTSKEAAAAYPLNWIAEAWGVGLCTDPDTIFHGHGSGYSLIGIAHKLGAQRILLLGYDMKFGEGYNGYTREPGETPRHYFGEYPSDLQHWPKQPWVDLIPLYKAINDQGLLQLISCTPDSALNDVLPYRDIRDVV
jgi:hypothetical protein